MIAETLISVGGTASLAVIGWLMRNALKSVELRIKSLEASSKAVNRTLLSHHTSIEVMKSQHATYLRELEKLDQKLDDWDPYP